MKKDDKIIKLFDEEGNEVSFNVVAFFDIVNPETDEKNEYVIVYEEGYSEDDTFALKVINGEDGEELLEAIDNEVELAAVQEAYNTIFIDIINDVSKNYNITKENKIFIANFYKYGFAGVIENWIVTEMKESPENIIKKLNILISGNFEEAVRKMSN